MNSSMDDRTETNSSETVDLSSDGRRTLRRQSSVHEVGHMFFDRFVSPIVLDDLPINYKKERNVMFTGYTVCFILICLFMATLVAAFTRLGKDDYLILTQKFPYSGIHPYPSQVCIEIDDMSQLTPSLTLRTIFNQYEYVNTTYLDMYSTTLQSSPGGVPIDVLCSPQITEGMQGVFEDPAYSFMTLKLTSAAANFTAMVDGSVTLWVRDISFPITDDTDAVPRFRTYHVNYGSYLLARYELYYSFVQVEILNKFSMHTDLSGYTYSTYATEVLRFERGTNEDSFADDSLVSFYIRSDTSKIDAQQRLYGVIDAVSDCGGMWSALILVATFYMFMYLSFRHLVKRVHTKRKLAREERENMLADTAGADIETNGVHANEDQIGRVLSPV